MLIDKRGSRHTADGDPDSCTTYPDPPERGGVGERRQESSQGPQGPHRARHRFRRTGPPAFGRYIGGKRRRPGLDHARRCSPGVRASHECAEAGTSERAVQDPRSAGISSRCSSDATRICPRTARSWRRARRSGSANPKINGRSGCDNSATRPTSNTTWKRSRFWLDITRARVSLDRNDGAPPCRIDRVRVLAPA